jgi:two-component system nitrate/nitrite sensor histidine kinase NarX
MREAIQTAHADVRENILSLRTTLANEKGLVSAMDEYLEEFSIQTGISANFMNMLSDDLNLSSIAEVQLVCILQEALTNVRKHAHASHITVLLQKVVHNGDEHVLMKVQDNGIGFKQTDAKRRFGLETMRERAQSVEGSFTFNSKSGKGTEIECRLPCLERENIRQPSRIFT